MARARSAMMPSSAANPPAAGSAPLKQDEAPV